MTASIKSLQYITALLLLFNIWYMWKNKPSMKLRSKKNNKCHHPYEAFHGNQASVYWHTTVTACKNWNKYFLSTNKMIEIFGLHVGVIEITGSYIPPHYYHPDTICIISHCHQVSHPLFSFYYNAVTIPFFVFNFPVMTIVCRNCWLREKLLHHFCRNSHW